MKVYVLYSYDDGIMGVYKTREAAVREAKVIMGYSDPDLVDEWDCYYNIEDADIKD